MRRFLVVLFALTCLAPIAKAATIPVTVATKSGPVRLTLEVVATPEARETGLMNRKTLAPTDGMLFLFPKTEPVQFWMKNTLLPLDMLFIDERNRIVTIHANAEPLSKRLIPSYHPTAAVIELLGGAAQTHHIAVGDAISYSLPADLHVE